MSLRDQVAQTLYDHHVVLLGPSWVQCRCGVRVPRIDPYNDEPGRRHTAEQVLAVIGRNQETPMSLVDHARRELELIEEDPPYAAALVAAVAAFASYGHSGGSASVAREQLHTLLQFRTLSPLTSNPDEWMGVSDTTNGGTALWQNTRDPAAFSKDHGQTVYYVDERAVDEQGEPVEGDSLRGQIQRAVNAHSAENGSQTPDFVLARFLTDCLDAFDRAVIRRAAWYGRLDAPGGTLPEHAEVDP